jgi:exosortase D (VPLPA-CTERM-specific)
MSILPVERVATSGSVIYRYPLWSVALLAVLAVALYLALQAPLNFMVQRWGLEEFSHGYLIPFIAAYLVWQRRNVLRQLDFKGAWGGVAVVMAGIALAIAGRLATLVTVQQLALLVIVAGLALVAGGRAALRALRMPILVLVFMIPLPMFIMNSLSSELQLISSTCGVWLMRQAGVAAFLEGNVIDLGNARLEVAAACSGLRYLLPLMTLAFLIACMYRAPFWKRGLIFLSSIPITLALNSVRIGLIGVLVDRWGAGMAEGAIHAVEGWMMFMLCTALLLLEVMMLARLGRDRRPWREVFGVAEPAPLPPTPVHRMRKLPAAAWAASALLVLFAVASRTLPAPQQVVPARASFTTFPLHIGAWSGRRQGMEPVYLDALKLDDYILANYSSGNAGPVNLYVAWYDQQTTGASTHSPKGCLPGGGWRIQDFAQIDLAAARVGGQRLTVNRALIQYENQRELVYYWFQQRGRVVTNEYLVKWYLLVDSVLRHRTDGALVRLIVPITPAMTEASADRLLSGFLATVGPHLDPYLPG